MKSREPPELPGMPGRMTKAAHWVRTRTQIFPPVGVGLGAGIGLGCAIGWPLRQAYGPPRAVCGPVVGVGIGIGYGQGFGRRFGSDTRYKGLTNLVSRLERAIDMCFSTLARPIRRAFPPRQ